MSKTTIQRDLREIMRDEMIMHDKIKALLEEGALTVPQVAEKLGYPSYEVMHWMMGMRRYNMIEACGRSDKDEGYYLYAIIKGESK